MIALLLLRSFARALLWAGLFASVFVGGLQLSCVQNFLISLATREGVAVELGEVSGFFPFDFSVDTLKVVCPDSSFEMSDVSIRLSKKFTHVSSIKLKRAKVKTSKSSEVSFSDIRNLIPVICQNFVKCVEIENLQTDDAAISNISFRRDNAKLRVLNLRVNDKDIKATFNINGSTLRLDSMYEGFCLRAEYKMSDGTLGINVLDKNSGKCIIFNGFCIDDSANGAISIPHLKLRVECGFSLHGALLDAEIKHNESGCKASVCLDMSNQILNVNKCKFGNNNTLMPFSITRDLKIKEINVLCKSGTVKLEDLDLSAQNFSMGSMKIDNISLSDWFGESISGTVSGSGKYAEDAELFNIKVSNFKFNNIKAPQININGKYSNDAIDAKISFGIFGKENIVNAKIAINNCIPSKNSMINVKWNGQAELIERHIDDEQIVGGSLSYDVKATGTLWKPSISGIATFNKGSYMNLKTSTYVKDISARFAIKDNNVLIEKITGNDDFAKRGSISGSGKITTNSKSLDIDLCLTLDKFGIVEINNFDGRLSGKIKINGDMFKSVCISGDLYADKWKLDISSFVTKSMRSVDIVSSVFKEKSKSKPIVLPIKIPVDIKIILKDGINITGHGINSLWNGGGRIFGDISTPQYDCKITLASGNMTIPGKVFKLRDGVISMSSADPGVWNVDVSAVKSFDTIKVGARLIQNKSGADIKFFSIPYVPKKDIISYMLFDRPSSDISAGDGITLLLAMNRANEGRLNVVDRIRSLFGVDTVEVKKAVNGNPEEYGIISLGKSLNNKTKISVDREGGSGTTKVVLESKVSKGTKVSVDMSGKDSIGAGISWNKRY
jgi:hypothetical protein